MFLAKIKFVARIFLWAACLVSAQLVAGEVKVFASEKQAEKPSDQTELKKKLAAIEKEIANVSAKIKQRVDLLRNQVDSKGATIDATSDQTKKNLEAKLAELKDKWNVLMAELNSESDAKIDQAKKEGWFMAKRGRRKTFGRRKISALRQPGRAPMRANLFAGALGH